MTNETPTRHPDPAAEGERAARREAAGLPTGDERLDPIAVAKTIEDFELPWVAIEDLGGFFALDGDETVWHIPMLATGGRGPEDDPGEVENPEPFETIAALRAEVLRVSAAQAAAATATPVADRKLVAEEGTLASSVAVAFEEALTHLGAYDADGMADSEAALRTAKIIVDDVAKALEAAIDATSVVESFVARYAEGR